MFGNDRGGDAGGVQNGHARPLSLDEPLRLAAER